MKTKPYTTPRPPALFRASWPRPPLLLSSTSRARSRPTMAKPCRTPKDYDFKQHNKIPHPVVDDSMTVQARNAFNIKVDKHNLDASCQTGDASRAAAVVGSTEWPDIGAPIMASYAFTRNEALEAALDADHKKSMLPICTEFARCIAAVERQLKNTSVVDSLAGALPPKVSGLKNVAGDVIPEELVLAVAHGNQPPCLLALTNASIRNFNSSRSLPTLTTTSRITGKCVDVFDSAAFLSAKHTTAIDPRPFGDKHGIVVAMKTLQRIAAHVTSRTASPGSNLGRHISNHVQFMENHVVDSETIPARQWLEFSWGEICGMFVERRAFVEAYHQSWLQQTTSLIKMHQSNERTLFGRRDDGGGDARDDFVQDNRVRDEWEDHVTWEAHQPRGNHVGRDARWPAAIEDAEYSDFGPVIYQHYQPHQQQLFFPHPYPLPTAPYPSHQQPFALHPRGAGAGHGMHWPAAVVDDDIYRSVPLAYQHYHPHQPQPFFPPPYLPPVPTPRGHQQPFVRCPNPFSASRDLLFPPLRNVRCRLVRCPLAFGFLPLSAMSAAALGDVLWPLGRVSSA
uniref:Uncharacterized protein n=1 Tax=Mycena chlorophos TaxID=658473 RepID=A0ABQ0LXG7_MYCCL|nr:predicted protein [Mycena chlorophos]